MELFLQEYVDGVNDTLFNEDSPIRLTSFTYSGTRMSVPVFTGIFYSMEALTFNGKQYVEYKGEKYFIRDTPTCKKSNTVVPYQYSVTFSSERDVLNHVYFYDVVTEGYDKYFTEQTSFTFNGTIKELSDRLNASMAKSGISYTTVVDEGVTDDLFTFSFSDSYVLAAIGQAFSEADVQFYFEGTTIHFGEPPYEVTEDYEEEKEDGSIEKGTRTVEFEYGAHNELLSIQQADAGTDVITRATGVGSSDNIPYYYPNSSSYGDVRYTTSGFGTSILDHIDFAKFKTNFALESGTTVTYKVSDAVQIEDLIVDSNEVNVQKFKVTPVGTTDDDIALTTTQCVVKDEIEVVNGISPIVINLKYSVSADASSGATIGLVDFKNERESGTDYAPYLLSSSGERIDYDNSLQSSLKRYL